MRTDTLRACIAVVFVASITGCDRLDMYDQPRYEPFEESHFYADGLSARHPVEGTIPRGGLREDTAYFTGRSDGKPVATIPEAAYRAVFDRVPKRFDGEFENVDRTALRLAMLERGRDRFDIYCSVCHGRTGEGNGMIVQRGFRSPPNYTIDRLRVAPAGHLFDVISNGIGAMSGYASRVEVADRWAIVAYIRALQLSQHAGLDDVPSDVRSELETSNENELVPHAAKVGGH